jgi:tetratricopeptide (TPR) repeat protein
MQAGAQTKSGPGLEELLQYLEQDRRNLSLLAEAAGQAFEAGQLTLAIELLDRAAAQGPLPDNLLNLKGLIAMAEQRFGAATEIFAGLQAKGVDDPGLRFSYAWSKAMMRDFQGALDLLDDAALAASPRAPALKLRLLHHLGRLSEALAIGRAFSDRNPHDTALAGVMASIAIDAEEPELAARYAKRAGDHAEGLAALGTLALYERDVAGSLQNFESALRASPDNPRALIGKGLGLLNQGDITDGAKAIDRGAEIFRTHIGSWVAAGWSHFLAGDHDAARHRFERALEIDPNFAESHGGLAVIHAAQGRMEEAARESEIALRLDKSCFGAALARSMILTHRGHPERARKITDVALATPVGANGETLSQMLAIFGRGLPR